MLDAKTIRTRLANLAFIPRGVPVGAPPEEKPGYRDFSGIDAGRPCG